ncbi:MAG: OmpH family outer membrane protein [Saprospirales bacterium]|nr:OmpH family outer membrane protein [Saprospirales bacterium]
MQNAINEVARENGYTHVLNQTTSGGVSTILYGPPEDDLTEKIFNKLGMQIPKE